ncbi:HNH endonuclease [Arthrobacter sp. MYb227]|uniref:HNH endonuclease signature motif containing protein n=1 Tax=Arthrobacter sp. MYb227 TaxID=1848601 RepID=UPI000CFA9C32|nr:HNH endonuclease signature motif containing protein [Arthrobacter sp. MYb227]PQZ92937.1 HNH endonuclease [Arthrobacter sp. MYb227]
MFATALIDTLTGHREHPEHQVSPDDELRAYAMLIAALEELSPRITSNTISRTRTCAAAQLVERAHRITEAAQLTATETLQRTNAHQLKSDTFTGIKEALSNLNDYAEGVTELPEEPIRMLTGRPTFKDTAELLQHILRIGYYDARDRVQAAARLLPHLDHTGTERAPRFPHLGKELSTGNTSPTQLARAAKKLEVMQPDIKQYPNAEALSDALESQIAESVREQDPRTTNKLFNAIEITLEKGTAEPSEETLRTKTGLFYHGTKKGIAEFLLKVRAADAELIHSLCAQTDNPRTKAGDREALANQANRSVDDASTTDVPNQEVTAEDSDTSAVSGSAILTENQLPHKVASESSNTARASSTSTSQSFPDFLINPETGQPFTNPADVQRLTMEPADTEAQVLAAMNNTNYGTDGLTPPQRHLQGLINLLRTNGRSTGRKVSGLPAPEMIIYTTLAELEGKAIASGIGVHGQRFTPAELRQQLCNAGVIPVVMDGKSQVLDLGTEERFFPEYMRKVILGIYGGCAFPGCTVPPEHCEIHHVKAMSQGGRTDINLALPGCANHHHGYHTGLIKIVRAPDGLFSLRLPSFMDPEQKLRRNNYWRTFPEDPTLF